MGLGKTIQSVTFVEEVCRYGVRGPYLIIVPLSTLGNWQREFEGWTDLNVIVYHGSTASRNMLQEYEMFYKDSKVGAGLGSCPCRTEAFLYCIDLPTIQMSISFILFINKSTQKK